MKVFNLPDLGEGLPDAEIVRWLVKVGDTVKQDQPMVEMETAKAVVEVPSPYDGEITALCGEAGDIIEVGAVLVEFDGDGSSANTSSSEQETVESKTPEAKEESKVAADTSSGDSQVFNLPDLGEGLPDAEIVRWLVKEGDVLSVDQPMVEMETAKAVVEVPSPYAGKVAILHGSEGDVIEVGKPLVTFGDAVAQSYSEKVESAKADEKPADAGTVVGAVEVGHQIVAESASAVVKALAKKLKVDLTQVTGSGANGAITQADVKKAKADGKLISAGAVNTTTPIVSSATDENPLSFKASPAVRAHAKRLGVLLSACKPTGRKGSISKADVEAAVGKSSASASASMPMRAAGTPEKVYKSVPSTAVTPSKEPQTVRGVRRAMAMGMAHSHATVVPTTLMEDADITSWVKQDPLARYVRALVFASKIEPSLNCWFDGEKFERIVHPEVHVGIAVDTPDGLYVPVVHDADKKDLSQIRARIQQVREKIENRGLKQEDQQGATVTLSNYGTITGRYGTPVVSPPQVAILGTGRFRSELQMDEFGISKRKILPLSLTFDHRACTGGEAARFLAAVIEDLQKAD